MNRGGNATLESRLPRFSRYTRRRRCRLTVETTDTPIMVIAAGVSAAVSSVLTSNLFSSVSSVSYCVAKFITPINLALTLTSCRSCFKNARYYQKLNARVRSLGCASTTLSDENSTSSVSISDNSYPTYTRLFPCPSQNGPPRVEHLVVLEEGPVQEYISKALNLPPLFVSDLILFGAVHYALVCPNPPPSATLEQIKLYKEFTDLTVLGKRPSIKGKTIREAQKTRRITQGDEFLEIGTYLRVHVHPKRFPRCYEIDWKSRIIAVSEYYVVLDKPAGISVGGTTDNIEESCVTFATRALGLESPLITTHQIDNCTEGCVVLARTKEFCSVFHAKIREKKVKKLYLALAAAPVPIGVITHYMRPVNIAPRLISGDFIDGWHLCQVEVLECRKVPWPNSIIEENNGIEACGWSVKNFAYECKINLLTGRTHQIRAQLAACGAPLVGDSMYMPAAISEANCAGLDPFGMNKKAYTTDNDKALAIDTWIAHHGKEPNISIGLQACQISWDEEEHHYEAGSPWWR